MPAFTAAREFDRVKMNAEVCQVAADSAMNWCGDSNRLHIFILGRDPSGLSRSAELAELSEAIAFAATLTAVSQIRVRCTGMGREATIRLYDGREDSRANSVEAQSGDDKNSQEFISGFLDLIKRSFRQQVKDVAAVPSSEVKRRIPLLHVTVNARTVTDLAALCAELLGYDTLPGTATFNIVGKDASKRDVTIRPKSFTGVDRLVANLLSIKKVSISVYGSTQISVDLLSDKVSSSEVEVVSTPERADEIVLRFTQWGRDHRLHGIHYCVSRVTRVIRNYGALLPVLMGLVAITTQFYVLKPGSTPGKNTHTPQIGELQQARKSLQRSLDYIDKLESDVRSQQAALEAIKKEHKEWDPVIQTDRKAIEQIGVILSQNARRDRWVDMGISFFIGVVSSLAASLLYLGRRRRENRAKDNNPSP